MKKTLLTTAVSALALLVAVPSHAELTANASVTNNYLWRGLTQSMNLPAIQGGVDWADDSGFYVGTWVSNVEYDPADVFSYEHDMYFGFAGEAGGISYDVGYLYYNYDKNANIDFGEIYGSLGYGPASVTAYVLTNTESDLDGAGNPQGWDFAAGETYYISTDLAFPIASGAELGFHAGFHEGDFAEGFNGIGLGEGYFDFNASISKDGFTFLVSQTSLGDDDDNDGVEDYASMGQRDNDEIKFVISYGVDFTL